MSPLSSCTPTVGLFQMCHSSKHSSHFFIYKLTKAFFWPFLLFFTLEENQTNYTRSKCFWSCLVNRHLAVFFACLSIAVVHDKVVDRIKRGGKYPFGKFVVVWTWPWEKYPARQATGSGPVAKNLAYIPWASAPFCEKQTSNLKVRKCPFLDQLLWSKCDFLHPLGSRLKWLINGYRFPWASMLTSGGKWKDSSDRIDTGPGIFSCATWLVSATPPGRDPGILLLPRRVGKEARRERQMGEAERDWRKRRA